MARKRKTEFWKNVRTLVNSSDIILEILDATNIRETRNEEMKKKVMLKGKALIFVINKSDLADKSKLKDETKDLHPKVFVSMKDREGIGKLWGMIMMQAKRKNKEEPVVGMFGYPNVGKSSILNSLKGRKSAKTSAEAGYTKNLEYVRCGNIMLIDSPGVIPYGEMDTAKHISIGAKNPDKIRNPIQIAEKIIKEGGGKIEKHFGVEAKEDPFDTIDAIAMKKGLLKKGGLPDTRGAAVFILMQIHRKKIK
ncbi:MAG: 50S ribosome-binding GTPase [Candidatus Aenigmarchaeota archaeon]|nr:50S ribosome-binding GTPase [Candidatus Aenigmarchaeota archaeon]